LAGFLSGGRSLLTYGTQYLVARALEISQIADGGIDSDMLP
jgi:hypothetical protein